MSAPNFIAKGNISPSRFVVVVGSGADFGVVQAAADTDRVAGISQPGTHFPGGFPGEDGFAATTGLGLQVFTEGDECLLKIGTGGCTRGLYLVSDGSGQGVAYTPGNTTNVYPGALALESASAGELARVQVRMPVALK